MNWEEKTDEIGEQEVSWLEGALYGFVQDAGMSVVKVIGLDENGEEEVREHLQFDVRGVQVVYSGTGTGSGVASGFTDWGAGGWEYMGELTPGKVYVGRGKFTDPSTAKDLIIDWLQRFLAFIVDTPPIIERGYEEQNNCANVGLRQIIGREGGRSYGSLDAVVGELDDKQSRCILLCDEKLDRSGDKNEAARSRAAMEVCQSRLCPPTLPWKINLLEYSFFTWSQFTYLDKDGNVARRGSDSKVQPASDWHVIGGRSGLLVWNKSGMYPVDPDARGHRDNAPDRSPILERTIDSTSYPGLRVRQVTHLIQVTYSRVRSWCCPMPEGY